MADGSIVKDPRFARLHSDPRFQRQPKKERKTVVDQRFSAMFHDESFKDKAAVDKYGRKLKKQKKKKGQDASELERLYSMDEPAAVPPAGKKEAPLQQPPAPLQKQKKQKQGTAADDPRFKLPPEPEPEPDEEEEEEDDDEDVDDDEDEGEGSTESEGDTDEEAELDDDDDEQAGASALMTWLKEQKENVTIVSDSTTRLAVCNCNWDHMRAADLLAVLRSFLPAGGRILSVAVYPSEFGEQQMALEATEGPSFLRGAKGDGASSVRAADDDDDDEEEEEEEAVGKDEANERLRKYELDRLRYFFGVVACDSARTAEHLYNECDGAEFESSSLPLDLRFIPEDMQFERKPRDRATELPPKCALASTAREPASCLVGRTAEGAVMGVCSGMRRPRSCARRCSSRSRPSLGTQMTPSVRR